MADIWAMCGHRSSSGKLKFITSLSTKTNQNGTRKERGGMEFESNWTKQRTSLGFAAQVIRSATSFMPWSCKISINEEFHEPL